MALSERAMRRLERREELRASVPESEYRRIISTATIARDRLRERRRRQRYREIWEAILMVESWQKKQNQVIRTPANSAAFRKKTVGA
jgi:hypothetical protein